MHKNNFDVVIIIPCYNEANRFKSNEFETFLSCNPKVCINYINDGSIDSTDKILEALQARFPSQVKIISRTKNRGKGFSVREGVREVLTHENTQKIAFIDADLSVSLEECMSLSQTMTDKVQFVFGSRKNNQDNAIERKMYRFVIGRIIAKVISSMLRISVYDTQCGCKIFTRDIAKLTFEAPFISKWLFDVEIFYRLIAHFGRTQTIAMIKESPVKEWIDTQDSRVSFFYAFRVWIDLLNIQLAYKPLVHQEE